jgi:putative membrane protein insertion efficiency factor
MLRFPTRVPKSFIGLSDMNQSFGAYVILMLLRFYRKFISPIMPPACRFTPSCSQYTYEAVERYGAFKGAFLGMKRIIRCNPFSKGGFDPVR